MAESSNDKLFRTIVSPIMDKVMRDLRLKQSEEMAIHTSSLPYIMAGAAGPDSGMSAQAASLATLRYTGKWNSKHTEDYIQMVKDEIPKSSIDYIMRKAATNTIFYLPQALNKSPLENHITAQAEKRYNPSTLEKGTGYVLGAAADYMTMGGIGGSWSGAAKFVGVDLALNAAIDKVGATETDDVPLIIAPEHRAEYKVTQAKRNQEQPKPKPKENTPTVERTTETQVQQPVKEQKEVAQTQPETQQEQPQQTNQNGWSGLLSSVGLNGISDIGHNLGYVLAMLPDMLVGIFTGKTKSLGLKDNMLPLASIVAGMFVRNPILKMVLIGMGGLNLLNKAGHEALDNHNGVSYGQGGNANGGNYKVYDDEALNARISQPQIKGNCLIATIDKVPCTIALPDRVVDAYNQGALPLNTLANAVLAKNDQMRQMAAENYAASEQQAQTRTLAQR